MRHRTRGRFRRFGFWDVVFLGRWVALVVLVAGVPLGPATSRVVVIAVIAVIGRSNE